MNIAEIIEFGFILTEDLNIKTKKSIYVDIMNQFNFKNKKILITGHTGFKGAWMVATLVNSGAENFMGYLDQIYLMGKIVYLN